MPDDLDKLGKTNSGTEAEPTESARKLNAAKSQLRYICQHLLHESDKYNPEQTVKSIGNYIKNNKIGRILYSEISSFIFGLNESERATASANLDTLISYVLDNEIDPDVQKISIKLYDHFQLNLIQLEYARIASDKAIAESIVDEKDKLHEDVKGIQKEYITILGIFAAILLAFVGSFTFSTSVLNNVGKVSTGKLLFIALIIGLVFILLLAILINFLLEINGRLTKNDKGKFKINSASKWAIMIISILLGLFALGYAFSKIDTTTMKNFFGVNENIPATTSDAGNIITDSDVALTNNNE